LAVAKKIGSPVITEDTDFRIETLNNEPGIRAGEFLKKSGRPGILQRMAGKKIAEP
jgi:inosine/xanthosine triphosphate pyrophosphatase family protein